MAEDSKEVNEKGDKGSSMSDLIASVPVIDFVEDVEAFMSLPENGNNCQQVLKKMEEIYSRIKGLESNHVNNRQRLRNQISELEKSIAMIVELNARKEANESLSTHFRLADHVFLKAKVNPAEKVGLWLGANVMLEYDLDEGDELLRSKKAKAELNLKQTTTLIDLIRENITTVEVNMARVYNFDVKKRNLEKEKAGITAS